MEQNINLSAPRASFPTFKIRCLALILAVASSCQPRPTPVVNATLSEIQTDISRGGQMV